jgi:hypothetical protein
LRRPQRAAPARNPSAACSTRRDPVIAEQGFSKTTLAQIGAKAATAAGS